MKLQVISIDLDGSITGLDHKKKGLDLRQFGKAETKRATLIEWHEERQRWFIVWASVPCGEDQAKWTDTLFEAAGVSFAEFNGAPRDEEKRTFARVVYFPDYEDAVAAEVAVIQAIQLKGARIH